MLSTRIEQRNQRWFNWQGQIRSLAFVLSLAAVLPGRLMAQQPARDLTEVSLENLLGARVESVSRRQQELLQTPAAVYVITQEDIRRSGINNVAELLRMVPGVNVAHIDSNKWAVTARGFNSLYENKLLVRVDGRSVYSPIFSGVYWNLQDLVPDDIEKIEVIRGPGATMWGANAVNGVISITTRKARDTQGGLFVAEVGSDRPGEGSFRYGGAIRPNVFYQVNARQTTRSSFADASGQDAGDSWNTTKLGGKLDWYRSNQDSFSFDAGFYRAVRGSAGSTLTSLSAITYKKYWQFDDDGSHISSQWDHSFGLGSALTLQAYFDETDVQDAVDVPSRNFDFDLQHDFEVRRNHQIVWGIGYRHSSDHITAGPAVSFNPDHNTANLYSGFIQDQITVVPLRLYLTAGTKVEHNVYTGYEVQPSIRLLWMPSARQSVWTAASDAARTANRADRGLRVNIAAFPAGRLPGLMAILPGNSRSETLFAYEAGHRYQAGRKASFDTTVFYNTYNHLKTSDPGASFFEAEPTPHLVFPLYTGNLMKGETYGAEVAANYRMNGFWSFKGSYSLLRMQLHADPAGAQSNELAEGRSPKNQIYVGSFFTLPKSFEVSTHAYFVGGLPSLNVPAYTRFDSNIGWKAGENLGFNLVGQNLFGAHHFEYGFTEGATATAVKRSVFGRITWRF